MMKSLLAFVLLFAFGCSQMNRNTQSMKENNYRGNPQENAPATLKGMLCNDVWSPQYLMAHPLVCIENGDYPGGSEMIIIKQSNPKHLVHVVSPINLAVPKNLKKMVILRGRFQKIKNKDCYKIKKPHDDYRYFVVSSWEYQK